MSRCRWRLIGSARLSLPAPSSRLHTHSNRHPRPIQSVIDIYELARIIPSVPVVANPVDGRYTEEKNGSKERKPKLERNKTKKRKKRKTISPGKSPSSVQSKPFDVVLCLFSYFIFVSVLRCFPSENEPFVY